jgi:hypothetical protein
VKAPPRARVCPELLGIGRSREGRPIVTRQGQLRITNRRDSEAFGDCGFG